MKLQPLQAGIFFRFIEENTNGRFINKSASGILISSSASDQANVPRWGEVIAIGPDVTDVAVGDFALIESGMWTIGFFVDGVQTWKTDQEKVLVISDEPGTTY